MPAACKSTAAFLKTLPLPLAMFVFGALAGATLAVILAKIFGSTAIKNSLDTLQQLIDKHTETIDSLHVQIKEKDERIDKLHEKIETMIDSDGGA